MLQPRCLALGARSQTSRSSSIHPLLESLTRLSLTTPTSISTHNHTQTRHASHATQGRANGAAQGPGKRLGAKRAATELVVPGCIIFRQRGAKWWPGENCVMGRDHTISALAKGYVRYYRDPENHPKRKFIGVVYDQNDQLPRAPNMARRRRLGLEPRVMDLTPVEEPEIVVKGGQPVPTQFKDGYQYRASNTQIGRAAKDSGIEYEMYKPGNRWLAWRLRMTRRKAAIERRLLVKRTSSKGKKAKMDKAKRSSVKTQA